MCGGFETLQSRTALLCYGEGRCHDGDDMRVLLLSHTGVVLYHDLSLLGTEKGQIEASTRTFYRPMVRLNIGTMIESWTTFV